MTQPTAGLGFLPWLRTGLAGEIDRQDGDPATAPGPASTSPSRWTRPATSARSRSPCHCSAQAMSPGWTPGRSSGWHRNRASSTPSPTSSRWSSSPSRICPGGTRPRSPTRRPGSGRGWSSRSCAPTRSPPRGPPTRTVGCRRSRSRRPVRCPGSISPGPGPTYRLTRSIRPPSRCPLPTGAGSEPGSSHLGTWHPRPRTRRFWCPPSSAGAWPACVSRCWTRWTAWRRPGRRTRPTSGCRSTTGGRSRLASRPISSSWRAG